MRRPCCLTVFATGQRGGIDEALRAVDGLRRARGRGRRGGRRRHQRRVLARAAPPRDGAGVRVEGAGSTHLADFIIRDNAGTGVEVVDGRLRLERSVIAGHEIGMRCGPEAAAHEDTVDFDDNVTDRVKDRASLHQRPSNNRRPSRASSDRIASAVSGRVDVLSRDSQREGAGMIGRVWWLFILCLGCQDTRNLGDPADRVRIIDARVMDAVPSDPDAPDGSTLDHAAADCDGPPACSIPGESAPLAECPAQQLTGVWGCVDMPPCPDRWSALEPGCEPPPPTECGAGRFLLGDGTCSDAWACPEGWRPRESERGCEPDEASCAGGDCAPWLVPPCGDATPGALHVDDDAPPGGDGTAATPFRALDDALALAVDGDSIYLHPGGYVAGERISAGVRLEGRCVDEVFIAGGLIIEDRVHLERLGVGNIQVVGAAVVADALHIRSDVTNAVEVFGGASLTASRVRVESGRVRIGRGGQLVAARWTVVDAPRTGFLIRGRANLRSVRISSSRPMPAVDDISLGIGVTITGEAILDDIRIEDMVGAALIVATEGATAQVDRLVVDGVRSVTGQPGVGVFVEGAASLRVNGALVEGLESGAVAQQGGHLMLDSVSLEGALPIGPSASNTVMVLDGARLDFHQLALTGGHAAALRIQDASALGRDLRIGPAPAGGVGTGVLVSGTGSLDVDGAWIRGRTHIGIGAVGEGSELVARRVRVERPEHRASTEEIWGLVSQDGADAHVTDLWVEGAFDVGVVVRSAALVGERVVVRPNGGPETNRRGVFAQHARLVVDDMLVEGSDGQGVTVADTSFDATNLTVRDTTCFVDVPANCGGVTVVGESSATIDGLVGHGNSNRGLLVRRSGLTGRRWVIRDTTAVGGQDLEGGVIIADRSTFDLESIELTDNEGVGLFVSDARTWGVASGLVIRRTGAANGLGGHGLQVDDAAWVDVEDARIVDSETVGVLLSTGARAELTNTAIRSRDRPPTGKGIEVQLGAHAELDGVHISQVADVAILVVERDARLTGADILVDDVAPVGGAFGGGVIAQDAGSIELTCLRVRDTNAAGLAALDGHMAVHGFEISGVRAGQPWAGDGVVVQDSGTFSASAFSIRDNMGAGVSAFGRHTQLSCGVISGHSVGIRCGPESSPSLTHVEYDNNGLAHDCDAGGPANAPPARSEPEL